MNLEACQQLFLSLAFRSTVLVALIWLGLKLTEKRSAPFRCALLTTGMLGLALLPLTWCLPRVEVPFLPILGTSMANGAVPLGSESVSGSPLIVIWFMGIGRMALCQSVGMWHIVARSGSIGVHASTHRPQRGSFVRASSSLRTPLNGTRNGSASCFCTRSDM